MEEEKDGGGERREEAFLILLIHTSKEVHYDSMLLELLGQAD